MEGGSRKRGSGRTQEEAGQWAGGAGARVGGARATVGGVGGARRRRRSGRKEPGEGGVGVGGDRAVGGAGRAVGRASERRRSQQVEGYEEEEVGLWEEPAGGRGEGGRAGVVVGGAQIHLSVFSHLDSKEEEEPEDLVLQQVVLCLCSLTVVDVQWCRRSRRLT